MGVTIFREGEEAERKNSLKEEKQVPWNMVVRVEKEEGDQQ